MASRPPRKSPARRRSRAARRAASGRGSRRKPARQRPIRKQPARKKRSPLFLLCFWPFLLVNRLTQSWPWGLRTPARLCAHSALLVLGLLVAIGTVYFLRTFRYDLARVSQMPERSIIYDRNMRELGRLHGEHRYIIDLKEVPDNFTGPLLAREDRRFRRHFGVDPRGILRSIVENARRRAFAQGASTITMQLARNAFKLPQDGPKWRKFDRKLLEVALALRIESKYSKDEILQHYMNVIFWGGSIHGVEAASRAYFEKPASELSLSEGAMLAGIIRAPNAFFPFEDLEGAKVQRNSTLDSMVRYGMITDDEAAKAKAEPLHIRPPDRRIIHGSYAMDAIKRDIEHFLDKESIKEGGLTIVTTIDKSLQESAERNLDKHLRLIERQSPGYRHQTRTEWQAQPAMRRGPPAYLQGAVVAVENRTGAIRAIVGGRDADESKFNRALHAKRQMGSVFKPFVFLAAFDQGLRPGSFISDDRVKPGEIKHAPANWSPNNSDGKYHEVLSVREALIKSRNTSSVRVGDFAGMKNVDEVAYQAFARRMPRKPSSFLGSWEATPKEVASAYTIFPNDGTRYRPFLISKILDSDGKEVYKTPPLGYRAARAGAAWEVSALLQEVTDRGTASSMRNRYDFQEPAGGKTGTTDNYHDAWFVGYSSSLTCAVWVGLDQPDSIVPKGYGSTLALPVWVEVMKTAQRLQRYEFKPMTPPGELQACRLCRSTGQRATAGCENARTAYNDQVPADLAPPAAEFCIRHPLRAVPVDSNPPPPPPPRAVPVPESDRPARAVPAE